jgi:hypothetical protein
VKSKTFHLATDYIGRGRAYSWQNKWDLCIADEKKGIELYAYVCRNFPNDGVARVACQNAADESENVAKAERDHGQDRPTAAANAPSVVPSVPHAPSISKECVELYDAAGSGDNAAAKALLDQGVDVNCRSGGPNKTLTSLMMAAYNGRTDTVKLLLERGADAALTTGPGESTDAITYAQIGKHEDIIQLLTAAEKKSSK